MAVPYESGYTDITQFLQGLRASLQPASAPLPFPAFVALTGGPVAAPHIQPQRGWYLDDKGVRRKPDGSECSSRECLDGDETVPAGVPTSSTGPAVAGVAMPNSYTALGFNPVAAPIVSSAAPRAMTKCDYGWCGKPTTNLGDGTYYSSPTAHKVLYASQNPLDTELGNIASAALQARYGGIGGSNRVREEQLRTQALDVRASPQWAAEFETARTNYGNNALAMAVADAAVARATPGLSNMYATLLGGAGEQAVDAARSQATARAAAAGHPELASPYYGGDFSLFGPIAGAGVSAAGNPTFSFIGGGGAQTPYVELPRTAEAFGFPVTTQQGFGTVRAAETAAQKALADGMAEQIKEQQRRQTELQKTMDADLAGRAYAAQVLAEARARGTKAGREDGGINIP